MTDATARNRRNKRAGAQWETDLLKGLRGHGFDVERLRLTGSEDEGDLVVRGGDGLVVIESKAGVMHPAEFVNEAIAEKGNYAKHRGIDPDGVRGIAIVKRRGHNWRKGYVLTTVEDYFRLG